MKRTNRLLVAAMTGLMATTSLGAIAVSAETTKTATETKAPEKAQYATQKQLLQTADDALAAITQVRTARIGILDNRIDDARTAVADATTLLAKAEADIGTLGVNGFGTSGPDIEYLPFDMSLSLTEAFTATEENKLALQKAYGLFESADPEEAIEILRIAEIDVAVSAALLPSQASMMHLQDASAFLSEGKYFEANLALKAVEDGVVVDTFGIDAIPEQGVLQ